MEKQKRKNEISPRLWTWKRFLAVTGMALAYGLIAVMTSMFSSGSFQPAYISFLIGIPFAIGALSIYTIPPPLRTFWRIYWISLTTTMLFLVVAAVYAPPTLLCIAMAIPLIAPVGLVSSLIMWQIDGYFRREKSKNQYGIALFLLLLPYIMGPVEANIDPAAWQRLVENEIMIHNTTPEEVWHSILNIPTIMPEEQRPTWYQSMGIPRPVQATMEDAGIGAVRTGEFEYGLVFYEEVILWEPNHAVEFTTDVLLNPQSTPVLEQIGGPYFDVLGTGYEIEALDETTVMLRLHSQYRLSTNFNFYGAFWSDWIMTDFQNYILTTIKTRIESD
jgi:hypothetical protein